MVFLGLLLSCRNDRSKNRLETVIPICDKSLYVEKYVVWGGGAFGGDMISAYLTDSVHFRILLKTYDNAHEGIGFKCLGDTILILNQSFDTLSNRFKVTTMDRYSIEELKRKKVFE